MMFALLLLISQEQLNPPTKNAFACLFEQQDIAFYSLFKSVVLPHKNRSFRISKCSHNSF